MHNMMGDQGMMQMPHPVHIHQVQLNIQEGDTKIWMLLYGIQLKMTLWTMT